MATPRKRNAKRKKTGLEAVSTRQLLKSIRKDLNEKLRDLGFEGPEAAIEGKKQTEKKGA
jgi:hypothetical protein